MNVGLILDELVVDVVGIHSPLAKAAGKELEVRLLEFVREPGHEVLRVLCEQGHLAHVGR